MAQALTTIDLQGALPLIARGKVRDLYEIDDKTLLFVASDRISAYDVIMENVSQQSLNLNTILTLEYRVSLTRASSSLSALKHGSRP
jgi:phosphoribosylaminoimidazole-succinocarboxamide synthase